MRYNTHRFWQLLVDFFARPDWLEWPPLTAAQQTMGSWARAVRTAAELPAIYQEYLAAAHVDFGDEPYFVLTPTYKGFLHRENEKLVFLASEELHVVERTRGGLAPISFFLSSIHYAEAGMILLHSWLTVRGVATSGELTTATCTFNAVTARLFTPFLLRIRAVDPAPMVDLAHERARFDALGNASYKFMNYGRGSILPGETVLAQVWQPELRTRLLAILGQVFYRREAPAHLCILTDQELILIGEDPKDIDERGRYGGIWTYVPRRQIVGADVTARGDSMLELGVNLPAGDRLVTLFASANRPAVETFLRALRERAGGA
jgi:hypothetical protein